MTFKLNKTNMLIDAVEVLETVFENGEITRTYTFEEVRANASVAFTGQV